LFILILRLSGFEIRLVALHALHRSNRPGQFRASETHRACDRGPVSSTAIRLRIENVASLRIGDQSVRVGPQQESLRDGIRGSFGDRSDITLMIAITLLQR